MPIFSFHLAETTLAVTTSALLNPPTSKEAPGLRHAECMMVMALGSPIFSSARTQLHHLAVFAAWDEGSALDDFLDASRLGRTLARGWHVRLEFLRRWGSVAQFADLPETTSEVDASTPVVAVTLARIRLLQSARFVRWGKPVERLVRDHPGTTLALAAMRPPRTISTFSVWRSLREMTEMVNGKSSVPGADRHASAMAERDRRDFHHEFTTLRFRALSESGEWEGRRNIIPGTPL